MSSIKEGVSIYRLPLLDGKNYAYWKARMSVFIRSIDDKAWDIVEEGWSRPVDDKQNPILKNKWTVEQINEAGYNLKALNAIFSAVDVEVFKLISTCLTANEAWNILKVSYEGTNKVRLQSSDSNNDEEIKDNCAFNVVTRDIAAPSNVSTDIPLSLKNEKEMNVINDREQIKKLDDKGDEAICLGYSANSHAYSVYLKESQTIVESINVRFNDDHEISNSQQDEGDVIHDVRQDMSLSNNYEARDISDSEEDSSDEDREEINHTAFHVTSNVSDDVITDVTLSIGTSGGTCHNRFSQKFVPICHYCEHIGHIRPHCFKYWARLKNSRKSQFNSKKIIRKVWKRKTEAKCSVVSTSIGAKQNDVACSKKIIHKVWKRKTEAKPNTVSNSIGAMQNDIDVPEKVPEKVPRVVHKTSQVEGKSERADLTIQNLSYVAEMIKYKYHKRLVSSSFCGDLTPLFPIMFKSYSSRKHVLYCRVAALGDKSRMKYTSRKEKSATNPIGVP